MSYFRHWNSDTAPNSRVSLTLELEIPGTTWNEHFAQSLASERVSPVRRGAFGVSGYTIEFSPDPAGGGCSTTVGADGPEEAFPIVVLRQ